MQRDESNFTTPNMVDAMSIASGLNVLLRAFDYAQDLRTDRWEFAVEVTTLNALGMTNTDLRWLERKGLVEHADETTGSTDARRTFEKTGRLPFSDRTCVVLTDLGVELARSSQGKLRQPGVGESPAAGHEKSPALYPKPHWDKTQRELWLGSHLVKRFKQPAPDQEAILDAFEEEGWPIHIDDPLPQQPNKVPERHLHDTINNLNRNQKSRLIKFHGDGWGQGVRWSVVRASGENGTP